MAHMFPVMSDTYSEGSKEDERQHNTDDVVINGLSNEKGNLKRAKETEVRDTGKEGIYRDLLRSLLHPLGVPDSTPGLKPTDLIEHLLQVFEVDRREHDLLMLKELQNKTLTAIQVNVTILCAELFRNPEMSTSGDECFCVIALQNSSAGKDVIHNASSIRSISQLHKYATNLPGSPRLQQMLQSHTGTSPPFSNPSTPSLKSKRYCHSLSAPNMLYPDMLPKVQHGHMSTKHFNALMVPKRTHNSLWAYQESEQKNFQRTSTCVVKNSAHPAWNEEFTLDVNDNLKDEVNIYVSSRAVQSDVRQDNRPRKKIGFGLITRKADGEHVTGDMCGKIVIPVKNISTLGTEEWYDIVALGSSKKKPIVIGRCDLMTSISIKQDVHKSFYLPNEECYLAYKELLQRKYTVSKEPVGDRYDVQQDEKDAKILKMFAEHQRISKLSQSIINVICLLESLRKGCEFGDEDLRIALGHLQLTWAANQIGDKSAAHIIPLTSVESINYTMEARTYIIQRSATIFDLPDLFPSTPDNLATIKNRLGVFAQLLDPDLWGSNCDPMVVVSTNLSQKLEADVRKYIDESLASLPIRGEDFAVLEIKQLTDLIEALCCGYDGNAEVSEFYQSLGVSYYRVISLALEEKVSSRCVLVIDGMNNYNKRCCNSDSNNVKASKQSLRLYRCIAKLHSFINKHVSMGDNISLRMFQYQQWFEDAMTYWFQAFKSECIQRMAKALELDKDVVLATNAVKYSVSSVDVLSCFAQVIKEWRAIDIQDPQCALIGVTKITDIICDCAKLYGYMMHTTLERNHYYQQRSNAQFEAKDRLCIILNNIEHVRSYLDELPELLAWKMVSQKINILYDNGTSDSVLYRLRDGACDEIVLQQNTMLMYICEKMKGDVEKYVTQFTLFSHIKFSPLERFLDYIASNLQTFNGMLMNTISPYLNEQLWTMILCVLQQQLQKGHRPSYYRLMKDLLRELRSFFLRVQLDEKTVHCDLYLDLKESLALNIKETSELVHMYFDQLTKDTVSQNVTCCNITFKTAYMKDWKGHITVFISVLQCNNLPKMKDSGTCNTIIEVGLQPRVHKDCPGMQRTHVINQSLNPVFHATLVFQYVPADVLRAHGACVQLSVFNYHRFRRNNIIGEAVVPLSTVPKIINEKFMDSVSLSIEYLRRPFRPAGGPFTVLSQRMWDAYAKRFTSARLRVMDQEPQPKDEDASTACSQR